ncbi:MAG: VOC family protein [Pseudomonadota bacterium]|mgnify:CR=1 FL=1|nr:VOC family protein [Pseudomonadota bacterium]
MKLDKMHHIAIQVSDIKKSVDWYKSKFACKVDYCDSSWALLRFANISMALVSKNEHPPHYAIERDSITEFGVATPHRDGTSSVYIEDLDGNTIEMLKL